MFHPRSARSAIRTALLALGCVVSPIGATGAWAQQAACLLVPGVDGELALGANLSSFRTTRPASIAVVNITRVQLFISNPTSWSSSPAGTPPTSFATVASLSGANVGSMVGGGAPTALASTGTTTAVVSLAADAASPFRAGLHAAQVTVTCTP